MNSTLTASALWPCAARLVRRCATFFPDVKLHQYIPLATGVSEVTWMYVARHSAYFAFAVHYARMVNGKTDGDCEKEKRPQVCKTPGIRKLTFIAWSSGQIGEAVEQ